MTFYTPVEAGRRLVPIAVMRETGITEYYDPERAGRFLHIPDQSPMIGSHQELARLGMSVFELAGERDGGVELLVPSGTMTVRQALRAVSRDLSGYTEIFHQLGGAVRHSEQVGVGGLSVLFGRTLLSSVAFAPDSDSDYGGRIHFVPPYSFDPKINLVDNLLVAREEMLETGFFKDTDAVAQVLAEVAIGYDDHGN